MGWFPSTERDLRDHDKADDAFGELSIAWSLRGGRWAAVLAAAVLSVVLLAAVCSAMIRSMASQLISSPSESMSAEHAVPLVAK